MLSNLKELFEYRNDGNLIWIKDGSYRVKAGAVAGTLEPSGYVRVGINGRRYRLHRLIFLYHHGYLPDIVDHIDRNISNNRIENLRDSDKSLNTANSSINQGLIPFRGVSLCNRTKKYIARITKNYKKIYLGSYQTPEEAYSAYLYKKKELFPDVFGLHTR